MTHREQRPNGWRALVERERERESAEARGADLPPAAEAPTCAWPGDATPHTDTTAAAPDTTSVHPHRATG